MAEGFITRRGGTAAERTAIPLLTLVEKTFNSITVTFTNNDDEEATIFYGLTTPPDDDSVLLASNATSSNITFSGLDDDTQFMIFAYALVTDPISKKIKSEIVSIQVTTDELPPFPTQFIDTSDSPGSSTPIADLDGNFMFDETKGIAYYGTVSHTNLFTSDEISSQIGLTKGTSQNNQEVWHKYYWNGGIHFWRKPVRSGISWNDVIGIGANYGTGTTISRKGRTGRTSVNQNAEISKNNLTYIVRNMEGHQTDPATAQSGLNLHSTEFNLILMNLHAATNSGSYSDSPTDGVTYNNWSSTSNFTNDDFVGWKTNLSDNDFGLFFVLKQEDWPQFGSFTVSRPGTGNMSGGPALDLSSEDFWAPVLTVKHPSFATYGKTGGFNQNEPDF